MAKQKQAQVQKTTGKYTLKDNRIFIKGLGIVEKPAAGKALPDEVVLQLFKTCEEAGLALDVVESAYLVEIEEAETEGIQTDQAE